VSRNDVTAYFREYVYGFMRSDIQRELDLAASDHGGGNVLVALGLVVYTEALGRIRKRNRPAQYPGRGPNEQQFNAAFDIMGPRYRTWRRDFERREQMTVYKAFRHGFAHEYAPKVATKVVMFGAPHVAIVKRGRLYVFVVEAYLRDFIVAAKRIERELLRLKNPTIPPPD
jgi:hypothetical protein